MNNQLPKLNIDKATFDAACNNNLPQSLEAMKNKEVIVDFEFLHVDNFLNRERLPVVIMIERFFFGLIVRRKRFFVHSVDGLLFLSRTDTGAQAFAGVFDAAKAADAALKLYESGNPKKKFVLKN